MQRFSGIATVPAARKGPAAGTLLREWRTRRRVSQLALALDSGVSARHLSFVETGRARASAELLTVLADVLTLPMRARNELLQAGGYAPQFPETGLAAPSMSIVRSAMERMLAAHDPYPGVALDRSWNVVLANGAARRMMALLPAFLTSPAPNMFRAGLHPQGFAAHTANFAEWGSYLLRELGRLCDVSSDKDVLALRDEVLAYQNVQRMLARAGAAHTASNDLSNDLLVPCILDIGGARLSMFTTLATLGSPRDVTLAELTVELFYPADEATAQALFVEG